jgi:hypothetical protein
MLLDVRAGSTSGGARPSQCSRGARGTAPPAAPRPTGPVYEARNLVLVWAPVTLMTRGG